MGIDLVHSLNKRKPLDFSEEEGEQKKIGRKI